MTASLQDLPTVGRLIAELNGELPGVTLYDIVSTLCDWNPTPEKNRNERYQSLTFRGDKGDKLSAYYNAKRTFKNKEEESRVRCIPDTDQLIVQWTETKSWKFKLVCNSGPALFTTFVSAYHSGDYKSYPLWGDPHPDMKGGAYWALAKSFSLWDTILDAPVETNERRARQEAILAARMQLGTSIDWQKEMLTEFCPSTFVLGRRLGRLTNNDAPNW